ncbi:RING finger protein 37 isoform X1 [Takifugu rubripes]|uniref:RING finger protein 37 isoform X1 n=1 Tax=Takifugu rubripes TaxID=31033 RepID=UPI0011457892|nr:RING finger protein 37 isoform X1 [Takifugu rubripes]
MVLNLCLPDFNTTVHCNKLCADGYDVTNLVSAEPAVRRRGFKLEYFLRPPVQVTLKFGFLVELCRLDVELWPWGMDQGQACKRLEISTSSDRAQDQKRFHKNDRVKMQMRDQHQDTRGVRSSKMFPGQQWSLQAQQWGDEALPEPQQVTSASLKTESSSSEAQFKLVGRCELREDTRVSFSNLSYGPRPPFPSLPPPHPAGCRQEELWSRGPLSLGAVTQLRVTIAFGGAASALGFKALAVWGQPARCCPAEELERIKTIHEACGRQPPSPGLFVPSVSQRKPPVKAVIPLSTDSIPDDFLDPITQEVMVLPMLLPSGMSVDNSTLEEHQKREATWGRAPNDPFTGVPFTSVSRPVPNPQLKSRIDHFLLRNGLTGLNGRLGRRGEGEHPQASRLVASAMDVSPESSHHNKNASDNLVIQFDADARAGVSQTENRPADETSQTSKRRSLLERGNKRHLDAEAEDRWTAASQPPKRQRGDALPSCSSSHEERLSASLDDALVSVLRGRPSFTSNLSLQRRLAPDSADSEPAQDTHSCQATSAGPAGGTMCSACSCSMSVYSKSTPSVYRLACGHLLCRSCLHSESQQVDAAGLSNHVRCPACRSATPRCDVVRVHR